MERIRRFSQTMASERQTALKAVCRSEANKNLLSLTKFVVSHKMPWYALRTAVKYYNKSLEKLQDFFFKTETETKCSRPRLHDPQPRPRLIFCPRGASRPRPWSRGLHHCRFDTIEYVTDRHRNLSYFMHGLKLERPTSMAIAVMSEKRGGYTVLVVSMCVCVSVSACA